MNISKISLCSFEQFKQWWTLLQSAARCKLLQNLCLIFPSLCLWSGQFAIVITPLGGNFSSLRPETSGINLINRQELWYNVGCGPGNSPGHSSALALALVSPETGQRLRWGERGGEGHRQAGRGTLPLGQVQAGRIRRREKPFLVTVGNGTFIMHSLVTTQVVSATEQQWRALSVMN